MLPTDIFTRVRYLTKSSTTDNVGDDTNLLAILNDYYLRQVTIFVDTNDDKFGIKTKTDLTGGQESYAMPSDLLKLKRIEATYDGTNWQKVHIQGDEEVENYAFDATTIGQRYSTSKPYADVYGDAIYVRPIPSATSSAGLRLYYIQRPSLLSNGSSTINVPSDYQGYLVYGVASEVATRQGNETLTAQMMSRWMEGEQKIKQTFAPRAIDHMVDFKPLPVSYS